MPEHLSGDTLSVDQIRAIYSPVRTNGYPNDEVWHAQDEALCGAGLYDLIAGQAWGGCTPVQFPGYGVLSGLTQWGMIRAGVSMIAEEMTRNWVELTRSGESGEDDADEDAQRILQLTAELEKFKVKEIFREAKELDGYYGGCLVFIDTGETDPEVLQLPLYADGATFKIGSLKGFRIIEPHNIAPGDYNTMTPWSEDYFKPRYWYVQGTKIHASRFLYFVGNHVGTLLLPSYNFFGISTSQLVLEAVQDFKECRQAATRLLKKFSTTVFKTDMSAMLQRGAHEEISRRVQYMVQTRDNDGVTVINNGDPNIGGEDILKLETPLSGVTDIVRQSMEIVSAYFREPAVKIWGISPAGFNATGEADMQNHYDHISTLQERIFRDPLTRVLDLLQVNLYGNIDADIKFTFAPLNIEDARQDAEIQKIRAERDTLFVQAGVLSAPEVRARLTADDTSEYNNLDIDDVPEQPGFDMGSMGMEEEGKDGRVDSDFGNNS